jgi:Mlc titration factor MtfA (ptsG expression regulator)
MPTRDPRPTKVKIGPQTYNIEYRYSHEDGMLSDGSHGYTLDQGNLIVIANELSVGKQKVVVMHEILHAMRMIFENGLPEKEADYEKWEHFFIGVYENALIMFMRDNPEIIDWMMTE